MSFLMLLLVCMSYNISQSTAACYSPLFIHRSDADVESVPVAAVGEIAVAGNMIHVTCRYTVSGTSRCTRYYELVAQSQTGFAVAVAVGKIDG